MTSATDFPAGTILGYPRIGPRRELKKAVEAFWSRTVSGAELEQTAADLRRATRKRLAALGLGRDDSSIPDDFSYYDQVLDAAVAVGAIPARFADLAGEGDELPLEAYFAIARGSVDQAPLEMTKWFDSNYHYLVPEIDEGTAFRPDAARLVRRVQEAREDGFVVRPVLVGPVTLLALSKPSDAALPGFSPLDRLADLVPVYAALLAALRDAGVDWVQLDEPALVSETLTAAPEQLAEAARAAYGELGRLGDRPAILVAASYGSLDAALPALAAAPIEAIALDLVRGGVPGALDEAAQRGLRDKVLVGGVIDGRNIWRADLESAFERLDSLRRLASSIAVGTSTSLFHVPHDATAETDLPVGLVDQLAFADQKVGEVEVLARGIREGREAVAAELAAATDALHTRRQLPGVRVEAVRDRIGGLRGTDFARPKADVRVQAQEDLGLPPLPTTTIGSFPQTAELRRARARLVRGELSEADYDAAMREEIARVIALQEELGLDVLVHGEPERNDMVQYFAEHLDGFAVTRNGWVQSYGSRCTRPSILWGDVSRPAPITVDWSAYAQSLTTKPVKGMLTGPVTILAWSFVRDDQGLGETANQVALALRDEIADLEAAGIRIVQVDEPALRELLPLKHRDQAAYLEWSVDSFRLATSGAAPRTQIHTHLCYSEFGAVIGAIGGLDADVTSIEAARSRMEVVADIAASGFSRGIGPGVYDIHSPRVPSVAEVEGLLHTALAAIPPRQLWVNPDCGLKTRAYPETIESLRNIVEAARAARDRVAATV
jgi:5-methyltetrahydropteroyltriglutamate--homocysteine methyltransferase